MDNPLQLLSSNTQALYTDLLDDNKYGPGNIPHYAINKTRFPNLIKTLNKESNIGTVNGFYPYIIA